MSDVTYTLTFKDKDGEVLHRSDDLPLTIETDMPGTLAAHYIMDNMKAAKDGETPVFPVPLQSGFAYVVRKRSDKQEAEEFSYADVTERIKALYGTTPPPPQGPGPV
jgi:hypothetical protein